MKISTFYYPVMDDGTIPHWHPTHITRKSGGKCQNAEVITHSFDASGKCSTQKWRRNDPFEDTIEFVSIQRGRSAAYFNVRSVSSGAGRAVFMTDLLAMIQEGDITGNKLHGIFQVVKRGQNYGIRLIEKL